MTILHILSTLKKPIEKMELEVVGIQLKSSDDLAPLVSRMKSHNFYGDYLNDKPNSFPIYCIGNGIRYFIFFNKKHLRLFDSKYRIFHPLFF